MKKLEKNIIRKVYVHETKRTVGELIARVLLIGLSLGTSIFIAILIFQTFDERGTFEVFGIFQEGFDAIRVYFFDVIKMIYQDAPKHILLSFIIVVAVFIFLTSLFAKNLSRMQKKLKNIYRYWNSK